MKFKVSNVELERGDSVWELHWTDDGEVGFKEWILRSMRYGNAYFVHADICTYGMTPEGRKWIDKNIMDDDRKTVPITSVELPKGLFLSKKLAVESEIQRCQDRTRSILLKDCLTRLSR